MKRSMIMLAALLTSLSILMMPAPAGAQERTRCFTETGHCISGPILEYWEQNGGLAVFGYPISDLRVETNNDGWTGPTQWFERDRLEDHANEGLGVLAGRLGASYLELQGRPWETFPRVSSAPAGCRYFPETGHSLCGRFLTYWERNGGLERFGYPITEAYQETITGPDSFWTGTVQYFERRRMEYHPEFAGTPYEVLLGLLGRDIHEYRGCAAPAEPLAATVNAYRDLLSCPAPYPLVNWPMATQRFERGAMVWVQGVHGGSGGIYVLYNDSTRNTLVWELYADTWREGMPTSGGQTPPQGLYEPIRGFGKLWRENAHVRDTLGWAIEPERATSGAQQYFRGGAWAIYRAEADRVYILSPDGTANDVPRVR